MALQATAETDYGESRSLYIRLNNVEASNHGADSHALFRGFISRDAYLAGKGYVWEREVTFRPDVAQPIWGQAYGVLKPSLPDAQDV